MLVLGMKAKKKRINIRKRAALSQKRSCQYSGDFDIAYEILGAKGQKREVQVRKVLYSKITEFAFR